MGQELQRADRATLVLLLTGTAAADLTVKHQVCRYHFKGQPMPWLIIDNVAAPMCTTLQVLASLQAQMKNLAALMQMLVPKLESGQQLSNQASSDFRPSSRQFLQHPEQSSSPVHHDQRSPQYFPEAAHMSSLCTTPGTDRFRSLVDAPQAMAHQLPEFRHSISTVQHPSSVSAMYSQGNNGETERYVRVFRTSCTVVCRGSGRHVRTLSEHPAMHLLDVLAQMLIALLSWPAP